MKYLKYFTSEGKITDIENKVNNKRYSTNKNIKTIYRINR